MAKAKEVSTAQVAPEWMATLKENAVSIVRGDQQVATGYSNIAKLFMTEFQALEIETGLCFERVTRASTGKLASAVNSVRDVTEAIFEQAGHKQPRGAWLKIQKYADEIRNGKAQKESSDTRAFKAIDEFVVEKLIALYNKAVRQAGENKTVDTLRGEWLAQLNKLGIKSDSKKLANNK